MIDGRHQAAAAVQILCFIVATECDQGLSRAACVCVLLILLFDSRRSGETNCSPDICMHLLLMIAVSVVMEMCPTLEFCLLFGFDKGARVCDEAINIKLKRK